MKKKLLLAGAMLLLAVAAVTGFAAYERANMSDLMDANVEALARNESGKNNKALAQKANGEYCCTPLNGNNCTQSPAC